MRRTKTRFELAQLATGYALSHQLGPNVMITFAHDDWCRMLKKGADCNCNPEMQVREIPEIPDDAPRAH